MSGQDKPVVVVTGGSRGIGKAIVDVFKERGWLVAACATNVRSAEQCGAHLNLVCDVSDSNAVQQLFSEVAGAFGHVTALINNAGIAGSNSLDGDDDTMWHRIIDVNLHGTYYMCKAALPYLQAKHGRIVNIASILGLRGVPDQTAYCAAKHGVVGLTRSLAHALAPRGITVNAICPSWTRTDMAEERFIEMRISAKSAGRSMPIGRIVEPLEVANFAYYLCSSEAAAITGQALAIDGGSLA